MADGKFLMNPGEARVRANEMTKIASELEMLLNDISRKMAEIDNVDTGVYQGDKKPAELRAELDQFRGMFNLAHEQIVKSANDIIRIANTMENE
jgi:hypothetical protein